MNNIITDNLHDAILEIDEVTIESTLDIHDAILAEYDKAIMIMETNFSSPLLGEMFYQEEESIMDKATGKFKDENIVWKVLAFIPRLFIAIGAKLVNGIKNLGKNKDEVEDTIDKEINQAKETIENADDSLLGKIKERVFANSDGKAEFDPKEKVFKLGAFGRIINAMIMIIGATAILPKIVTRAKAEGGIYAEMGSEIKKIITLEKTPDMETYQYSITALGQLLHDFGGASIVVSAASKELSQILKAKIDKEMKKGNNPEQLKELQVLSKRISVLSRNTAIAAPGLNLLRGIIKSSVTDKIVTNVATSDSDTTKEMNEIVSDNNVTRAQIKAEELKAKRLKKQIKKAKKNESKLNELESNNEYLDRSLAEKKRKTQKLQDKYDRMLDRDDNDDE